MKKTVTIFFLIIGIGLFLSQAKANVIGTEYQNFNPTYSGLDFTTVQSSETLKPCLCNIGLFFNYAKNTLTYSDTYYQTNTDLIGQRANDFLIGADFNLGFGLTKYWDVGLSLPFVVSAKNDDPYGVSYFEQFGLTEIRPATKVRFYGDDNGGIAAVLSANFNVIENNPFSGKKPGPTINLELIGDTTTQGGTKLAWNLGYRFRNPGAQVTSADLTSGIQPPFVPFKSSWVGALALATGIESWNSDLIAELVGSHSDKLDESDSARKAQQALEFNLALRHDWSKSLNIHSGLGTKLANAQSSPDIRAYLGLNMNFGPICNSKSSQKSDSPVVAVVQARQSVVTPIAIISNHPEGDSEQTELDMPISAVNPTDYQAYSYKIGPSPETDCTNPAGYSDEISGTQHVVTTVKDMPDGGITMCTVAKNNDGLWQIFSVPTIARWQKVTSKEYPQVIQKKGYEVFRLSAEVLFDFSKDNIRSGAQHELDKIDRYLKLKPYKKVIIEGHTDNKGTDAYNMNLSQRRAVQVRRWMIQKYAIDGSKLTSKGLGESVPVDTNKTDQGRQNNRRVEFKIYR